MHIDLVLSIIKNAVMPAEIDATTRGIYDRSVMKRTWGRVPALRLLLSSSRCPLWIYTSSNKIRARNILQISSRCSHRETRGWSSLFSLIRYIQGRVEYDWSLQQGVTFFLKGHQGAGPLNSRAAIIRSAKLTKWLGPLASFEEEMGVIINR